MSRILEVCVDSYESAVAAIDGGAHRLELCASLADGGLTPTPGLLLQVLNYSSSVPVFCMLRCRPGDYTYTSDEVEIMKQDAKILQKLGASGFVFGALNAGGEVDMRPCREIIMACHPLPVTFHRAFDLCRRPTIEAEVVVDLGFKRVLTSGLQRDARLGAKMIRRLAGQVGGRIGVIAGAGISRANLEFIVEETGVREFHGSFKRAKEAPVESEVDATVSRQLYVTDRELVAEICQILKTV